jgi:hypothetical protein
VKNTFKKIIVIKLSNTPQTRWLPFYCKRIVSRSLLQNEYIHNTVPYNWNTRQRMLFYLVSSIKLDLDWKKKKKKTLVMCIILSTYSYHWYNLWSTDTYNYWKGSTHKVKQNACVKAYNKRIRTYAIWIVHHNFNLKKEVISHQIWFIDAFLELSFIVEKLEKGWIQNDHISHA